MSQDLLGSWEGFLHLSLSLTHTHRGTTLLVQTSRWIYILNDTNHFSSSCFNHVEVWVSVFWQTQIFKYSCVCVYLFDVRKRSTEASGSGRKRINCFRPEFRAPLAWLTRSDSTLTGPQASEAACLNWQGAILIIYVFLLSQALPVTMGSSLVYINKTEQWKLHFWSIWRRRKMEFLKVCLAIGVFANSYASERREEMCLRPGTVWGTPKSEWVNLNLWLWVCAALLDPEGKGKFSNNDSIFI